MVVGMTVAKTGDHVSQKWTQKDTGGGQEAVVSALPGWILILRTHIYELKHIVRWTGMQITCNCVQSQEPFS